MGKADVQRGSLRTAAFGVFGGFRQHLLHITLRFHIALSCLLFYNVLCTDLLAFAAAASSPTYDRSTADLCKVTYAVNCGGPGHTAVDGVTYKRDSAYSGGITSDAGNDFSPFPRVEDDVVYRTERYDSASFTYTIPIINQGTHTITLKFSEVYFRSAGEKVFDVKVGGHTVLRQLDIFRKVGKGVPHDEYVEVKRDGNQVTVNGSAALNSHWDGKNGKLKIQFVKLPDRDNPKVNGIVVHRCSLPEVPKLRPLPENSPSADSRFFSGEDDVGTEGRYLETVVAPEADEDEEEILSEDEFQLSANFRILLLLAAGCSVVFCCGYMVLSGGKPSPPPNNRTAATQKSRSRAKVGEKTEIQNASEHNHKKD